MADIEQDVPPLPLNFYNYDGWVDSLIQFYCNTHNILPEPLLRRPFKVLTDAVGGTIDVYGNFPEDTRIILYQTIDNKFSPQDYREKIYKVLKEEAVEKDIPGFAPMADHLLRLRLMFEVSKKFLETYFPNEIQQIPDQEDGSDKLEGYGTILRDITIQHINQVIGLIKDFEAQQSQQTPHQENNNPSSANTDAEESASTSTP